MTCHWLCADKVIIPCEVSPPSAHTGDDYTFDDEENFDEDKDEVATTPKLDHRRTLKDEKEEGCRTPTPTTKALSQVRRSLVSELIAHLLA